MTAERSVAAVDPDLLGRLVELNVIRGVLTDVVVRGDAVHIHGDAGIGKSTLLAAASRLARNRGFTVVVSSGSQAESHLPFAALYELLRPLLTHLGALPAGHRSALTRAFGLVDASPGVDSGADRFFICLAAQELLAAAAAQAPILLLADDVQWWDAASRETLAFVARRITAVPAVLLSAARDTNGTAADLGLGRSMGLAGLATSDARMLLREQGDHLSPRQVRLVLDVAEGNPLALIELPLALNGRDAGWSGAGSGASAVSPDAVVVPLTSRLEQAFAARLRGLREDSRTVLLVAALLDGDLVSELVAAASELLVDGEVSSALDGAVRADLIRLDDVPASGTVLRFRHPLVRSAVVQLATVAERRAAHQVLASSLAACPDRAAWHRAAAASGPDEDVAAGLEQAAEHALGRGASSSAAALFEWAADLSVADQRRGHRLLRAAELAFELGRSAAAERLIAGARQLDLEDVDRSRLVGLNAVFDGTPGSADDIRRIVRSAERVLADGDQALAAYLLVGAARRCHWGDAPGPVRDVVMDAAVAALPETDPRRLQITAFLEPLGRGADVVSRLTPWVEHPTPDPATSTMLGIASYLVADFDRTLTFVDRSRAALRQQGRTELLAQGLAVQAMAGIYLGRFSEAHDAAQAAYELTRETRQPIWKALAALAKAMLSAVRGHGDAATSFIDEAEQTAMLTNNRALVNRVQFARGLAELGAEQRARAFSEFRRMLDSSDPAFHLPQAVWGIDFLAESSVSVGDREEARALLGRADDLSSQTSAPGVRRALALAHALLADDEADAHFVEAARWAAEATPWFRARLDLAHGAWLGRQGRTTESRRKLRSARTVFLALDTPAWSARAAQELDALEQHSGRGGAQILSALSPQELQVAELAAVGLSNRDIADRLHLSHRTVGSHLYRIYPKLGIRSRTQLHIVLRDQEQRRQ